MSAGRDGLFHAADPAAPLFNSAGYRHEASRLAIPVVRAPHPMYVPDYVTPQAYTDGVLAEVRRQLPDVAISRVVVGGRTADPTNTGLFVGDGGAAFVITHPSLAAEVRLRIGYDTLPRGEGAEDYDRRMVSVEAPTYSPTGHELTGKVRRHEQPPVAAGATAVGAFVAAALRDSAHDSPAGTVWGHEPATSYLQAETPEREEHDAYFAAKWHATEVAAALRGAGLAVSHDESYRVAGLLDVAGSQRDENAVSFVRLGGDDMQADYLTVLPGRLLRDGELTSAGDLSVRIARGTTESWNPVNGDLVYSQTFPAAQLTPAFVAGLVADQTDRLLPFDSYRHELVHAAAAKHPQASLTRRLAAATSAAFRGVSREPASPKEPAPAAHLTSATSTSRRSR